GGVVVGVAVDVRGRLSDRVQDRRQWAVRRLVRRQLVRAAFGRHHDLPGLVSHEPVEDGAEAGSGCLGHRCPPDRAGVTTQAYAAARRARQTTTTWTNRRPPAAPEGR